MATDIPIDIPQISVYEIYDLPIEPTYHASIRKLQDSDPASASGTFNPVLQKIIENTHFMKLRVDNSITSHILPCSLLVKDRRPIVGYREPKYEAKIELQAGAASLPGAASEQNSINVKDGIEIVLIMSSNYQKSEDEIGVSFSIRLGERSYAISGINPERIKAGNCVKIRYEKGGFHVVDADLSTAELKENRTPVITKTSTDSEYPTAKAVYDFVGQAALGITSDIKSSIPWTVLPSSEEEPFNIDGFCEPGVYYVEYFTTAHANDARIPMSLRRSLVINSPWEKLKELYVYFGMNSQTVYFGTDITTWEIVENKQYIVNLTGENGDGENLPRLYYPGNSDKVSRAFRLNGSTYNDVINEWNNLVRRKYRAYCEENGQEYNEEDISDSIMPLKSDDVTDDEAWAEFGMSGDIYRFYTDKKDERKINGTFTPYLEKRITGSCPGHDEVSITDVDFKAETASYTRYTGDNRMDVSLIVSFGPYFTGSNYGKTVVEITGHSYASLREHGSHPQSLRLGGLPAYCPGIQSVVGFGFFNSNGDKIQPIYMSGNEIYFDEPAYIKQGTKAYISVKYTR